MSSIIGIVAVDRQGAIGRAGALPWRYSSDMKFFRRQTTGNACVMGHRTWLSLAKPLPDRLNIVLSRSSSIEPQESVVVLRDKQSVLSLKKYLACDLYVIGGRQIYESFLGEIDRWLVTEVPLNVSDADTFMPKNFLDGFTLRSSTPLEEGLSVSTYERE
jgi:dihydrofolate reductase